MFISYNMATIFLFSDISLLFHSPKESWKSGQNMWKPEDIGPITREKLLNVYDFILMFHKKSCHGCNTIKSDLSSRYKISHFHNKCQPLPPQNMIPGSVSLIPWSVSLIPWETSQNKKKNANIQNIEP